MAICALSVCVAAAAASDRHASPSHVGTLLLQTADLPGAGIVAPTVASVQTIFLPGNRLFGGAVSAQRQFAFAKPYGASGVTAVTHEVTVLKPSDLAGVIPGLVVYALSRSLLDPAEAQRLGALVGRTTPATEVSSRVVDVGESALEISFTVEADGTDEHVAVVVYTVANLLESVTTIGPADSSGDALSLARLADRRRAVANGPAATSPPHVEGAPRRGGTLTAIAGRWTRQPDGFEFTWLRCDVEGAHCRAIRGANGASYVVGRADVGRRLRVRVVARNTGGTGEAVSAPTAVVR